MDLTKLLGGLDLGGMMGGLTDMLGSQGMQNLIGGGLGLYNTMQAGNMMDFQKDLMSRNEARSQDIFDREKSEEEARHALDF